MDVKVKIGTAEARIIDDARGSSSVPRCFSSSNLGETTDANVDSFTSEAKQKSERQKAVAALYDAIHRLLGNDASSTLLFCFGRNNHSTM